MERLETHLQFMVQGWGLIVHGSQQNRHSHCDLSLTHSNIPCLLLIDRGRLGEGVTVGGKFHW